MQFDCADMFTEPFLQRVQAAVSAVIQLLGQIGCHSPSVGNKESIETGISFTIGK